MKNNRLPKSWAVKNDGSQLFKDTVIEHLNNQGANFNGDVMDCYYGIATTGFNFNDRNSQWFKDTLTLQEFISLTSEEDVRENEWDFREGDVLIHDSSKIKILGICGGAVFISLIDLFYKASDSIFTREEIYNNGWRLHKEEPEVGMILTKQQIADKFGVEVSQIIIKE